MVRSIGREVARIYEDRRQQAELKRVARVDAVYQDHPQLRQLDQDLAQAGAELLLEAIEPDRPRLAAAKRQFLQEKRLAYLAAHKIARDFDKPHFTCPACKDTSWLPEGRCPCYQAVLVPLLMSEANLPQWQMMNFANFDANLFSDQVDVKTHQSKLSPRQHILRLRQAGEDFVRDFALEATRSMLFIGSPGTGKTFLMSAIGQALLESGRSVLYMTAPQLFDHLQEHRILQTSYNPDPNRLEHSLALQDSIYNCNLLLVDDLGTETGAATRYTELLSVIDSRQGSQKKMIISTNADPLALRDHYDERLLSRLVGGFAVYRFFGQDVRLEQNRRRRR